MTQQGRIDVVEKNENKRYKPKMSRRFRFKGLRTVYAPTIRGKFQANRECAFHLANRRKYCRFVDCEGCDVENNFLIERCGTVDEYK